MRGGTPNQAVFDELVAGLDAKLNGYDAILAKQKYLAGDVCFSVMNEVESSLTWKHSMQSFTLADLFHLPYGSLLAYAGTDVMERKPNVARYVLLESGSI
jgi:glutathione S-transferase